MTFVIAVFVSALVIIVAAFFTTFVVIVIALVVFTFMIVVVTMAMAVRLKKLLRAAFAFPFMGIAAREKRNQGDRSKAFEKEFPEMIPNHADPISML